MSALHPSQAPFYRIVPGMVETPISQITLPVTFGTQENFRTEHLQFEIADFETSTHKLLQSLIMPTWF
jgi:hypothetical protein